MKLPLLRVTAIKYSSSNILHTASCTFPVKAKEIRKSRLTINILYCTFSSIFQTRVMYIRCRNRFDWRDTVSCDALHIVILALYNV